MTFSERYRLGREAYQAGNFPAAYEHFTWLAMEFPDYRTAIATYGWIRGVLSTKGARVAAMLEKMPPLGAI